MITPECIQKLRNVYKAIGNFETEMQRAVGLNLNEAMLLCLLSDGSMILAGDIAEKLGLTRSNASKVIAALEKVGCILRESCSEDSRCQKFHISGNGMKKLKEMENKLTMPQEIPELCRCMNSLSSHDREEARKQQS